MLKCNARVDVCNRRELRIFLANLECLITGCTFLPKLSKARCKTRPDPGRAAGRTAQGVRGNLVLAKQIVRYRPIVVVELRMDRIELHGTIEPGQGLEWPAAKRENVS